MDMFEVTYNKGNSQQATLVTKNAFAEECKRHFSAMLAEGGSHLLEIFIDVETDDDENCTISLAVDRLTEYELKSKVPGTSIVVITKRGHLNA